MFVGITRAQEELQISMARYRDFRGQRKMTVPSHFLMELPREEMELQAWELDQSHTVEPAFEEPVLSRPKMRPRGGGGLSVQLTTAAELANGGQPTTPVSPEAFRQGMVVRHPQYGLGRVAALSGSGEGRAYRMVRPLRAGRVRRREECSRPRSLRPL